MSCWFLEPKVYYVKLTMNMAHSPLTTWKCPNETNCVHFKLSIILSVQTFQMSNVLLEKCANFLKLHHYWQHTDFEQPELEVLVHCPFSVFSYIASGLSLKYIFVTWHSDIVNYLSKICYIAFYFYSYCNDT